MDTSTARTQLEQALAELDSATPTLQDEGAGETSELSHVTQHPGDVGSEVADDDRETALLEAGADQRAQVVAALARIDDGTYGTCVDCGQPIDDAAARGPPRGRPLPRGPAEGRGAWA